MERIEKSVEVKAPVRAVYNQCTQFEEFPRFMAGVKEVKRLDDTHCTGTRRSGARSGTPRSPSRCPTEPQGLAENVGHKLGVMSARVQNAVEDFKKFIEARGQETGGWRGEVHGGTKAS